MRLGPVWIAITASLLAGSAGAQKQATTLELLTRRAPLVLRITVTSTAIANDTHEVRFRVDESLRGRLAGEALLRELSHRHCGSSCAGLAPKQQLVLFARESRGAVRPIGGSRGIVHAGENELAAIRALLATTDASRRIATVAAQLADRSLRVREDAALALPLMAHLERAAPATKRRITEALDATRSATPRLAGLLTAAARVAPESAARRAWQLALGAGRGSASLGRGVLLRQLPARTTVATAPRVESRAARLEVVRVLAATRAPDARPVLAALAAGGDTRVRSEALVGLLRCGAAARTLVDEFGDAEVTRAESVAAQRRSRRFRAIRPAR